MNEFTPYGYPSPGPLYLQPTEFLDFGHPLVASLAQDAVRSATTQRQRAVALFSAVRDRIRYNPYNLDTDPKSFGASAVVRAGNAFCIPKAVLLVAAARSVGIPSAIGLADVKNHFSSARLRQSMGGKDIFLDHGYAALYVDGGWLKVAPAFNRELCERMGVPPTDFDGASDALLQVRKADGQLEPMRYLHDHGLWSDLPFTRIRDDFMGYYPASMWNKTVADRVFETNTTVRHD